MRVIKYTVNNIGHVILCDVYFSFFWSFIKGIVHIYIVFLKRLMPLFLYLTY